MLECPAEKQTTAREEEQGLMALFGPVQACNHSTHWSSDRRKSSQVILFV